MLTKKRAEKTSKATCIFLGIAGAIFFCYGGYLLLPNIAFYTGAQKTEATLIGYEQKETEVKGARLGNTRTTMTIIVDYPKLSFIHGDKTIEFTDRVYMKDPKPFRVGDRISILYDPQDPNNARIPQYKTLLMVIGMVVMGGGFLWLAFGQDRKKKNYLKLRSMGQARKAEIVAIELWPHSTKKSQYWIIKAQLDGRADLLTSKPLRKKPPQKLMGSYVDVYFKDSSLSNRYEIDAESLDYQS